jgi:hypothetical protein
MPDVLSSCSANSQQSPILNKQYSKINHDSFGNIMEKNAEKTTNNKLIGHVFEKELNIKDENDKKRDLENAKQAIPENKIDKSRPISSINIVGTPW